MLRVVFALLILITSNIWARTQNLFLEDFDQSTIELVKASSDVSIDSVISLNKDQDIVIITEEGDNVILTQLQSGSLYRVFTSSDRTIADYTFATQSNSTGAVEHFFNFEVPEWPGSKLLPTGTTFGQVEKALRDRIRSAKHSIDYCAYNTNVTSIVNELIDAKARGVQVRVIAERENNNTALHGSLPFPVLYDRNSNLMHNKFIIIDPDEVTTSYVVTGSMNFTSNQMRSDPNHLMILQDQALARSFQVEFEEMWGSDTENFNFINSKFGPSKADNTPHHFKINGIEMELYFSPTDGTTQQMIEALNTADYQVDLGLLIFTNRDLRDTLLNLLSQEIRVRGIIEDDENSDDVVTALNRANGDIRYHRPNGIYHHKMAIIDAEHPDSDPLLISGSHNWTFTAENGNDENTLIIHDSEIAELYKRAFSAFWVDLSTSTAEPTVSSLVIYPNPATHHITFKQNDVYDDLSSVKIYDHIGRSMKISWLNELAIDISSYPNGIYFIQSLRGSSFFIKH